MASFKRCEEKELELYYEFKYPYTNNITITTNTIWLKIAKNF